MSTRLPRSPAVWILAAAAAAISCAGGVSCAEATAASATARSDRAAAAATARPGDAAAPAIARPGRNLLVNPAALAGAVSAQGWDSVTIPGWRIVRGLPTVVRVGTKHFPGPRAGGNLFAGGAGGTALLRQRVALRTPAGRPLHGNARWRLSGALGGTATSAASVTATFMSAGGRPLAHARIGPVGHHRGPSFGRRSATGRLPAGAVAATITVRLATSETNIDGPYAPKTGYDRAVAGDLRFRVGATVVAPARLRPPVSTVPRFDHVFLFMFENQDFHAVIGNRRRAPYLNSLLPHASVLANLYAEEHPSDGNYLAIAAGGLYGLPLTDPLEINPRYTIDARNIGDLVDSAHKTWRAYLQSANGPCDDTVHGYYWDDDLPFLYFRDIRDRPAYCSRHVVPLQALGTDLARAATTPSFSWIGADDCSDMEGCGVRAGDRFLQRTLGAIMRSPAWTRQRSLAIITFDEDNYDHERPPQLIPTIVLGSAGVRQGFTSHVRYTHYSLLRTIEGTLGLGTLTRNDRYAQPLNDVFGGTTRAPRPANSRAAHASPVDVRPVDVRPVNARPVDARKPMRARPRPLADASRRPRLGRRIAFVANYASGTVTPVSLSKHIAGAAIRVGARPAAIAATPNGREVFVANSGSGTVTPIDARTRRAGAPIRVGADPSALAVAPGGRTVYVVNSGADSVTPIDVATRRAGSPIRVGTAPRAIAITPNGATAYVLDWGGASVTPIDLAHRIAARPIPVGSYPEAIALAPGGSTAYVGSFGANTVTPIHTGNDRAGRPIRVGQAPGALAVSGDGSTVEVVGGDAEAVTPIDAARLRARHPIAVGRSPADVTVVGGTAWVTNTVSGTVTPIDVARGRAGKSISVGTYSYPTQIVPVHGEPAAVVADTYAGRISIVSTRSRRQLARVKVGRYPLAIAIAR